MKMNRFKLVQQDPNNDDQYLVGFYETKETAEDARVAVAKKNPPWITSWRDLMVKRVNPDMILNPVATDYSHYISSLIPDSEWQRVMGSDSRAEIDCNNCCCGFGGRTYYNLSKMIPKDWTVIDIGCGYNPQSYLFQTHAWHIAIEPVWNDEDFHFEYFQAPNTELLFMSGQDFLKHELSKLGLNLKKTFCIVNYVPSDEVCQMARNIFSNIFTFYPA